MIITFKGARGLKNNILSEYLQIYISFFKIGFLTFGGGYAMLPILENELVGKRERKWMEKAELLDYFAMSQSLPGIIAVNAAVFCGSKRREAAADLNMTHRSVLSASFSVKYRCPE